jgi:hypothetical protein
MKVLRSIACMEDLRTLASACASGSCPTIYESGDELVVQGYVSTLATPEGEQAVRIPKSVLINAAAALGG